MVVQRVSMLRPSAQTLKRALRARARQLRLLAPSVRRIAEDPRFDAFDGLLWTSERAMTPTGAADANRALVTDLLEERSIRFVPVRNATRVRATVAIAERDQHRLIAALRERFAHDAVYVQSVEGARSAARSRPTSSALLAPAAGSRLEQANVIRVGRLYVDPDTGLRCDLGYGCDVEIWRPTRVEGVPGWETARPTVAGTRLPEDVVGLSSEVAPELRIFERALLDDVTFPIDVVYTWVDGADPAWRAKLDEHRVASGYHAEATAPSRFTSRNELKYSLRTLFMFAPWIRHVYLVTDGQVPGFLDPDHPRLTIVDHREIAPDPAVLPVFSSNAITTWLHRIPGLSEHYLYLNDDMFFGRPVDPSLFFTGGGLCRVFPGRTPRPFGPPDPADPPHVNLSRNIRALIEEAFGRTFVHAIRHTPYPQRVSIHQEMEARFGDAYRRTASHRFRHHEDIAGDQLFHYYALATGRAVVGSIRYDYVNVNRSTDALERLRRSNVDVFCLNDGPKVGPGIPDEVITAFLEAHAPVPSPMETDPRRS